MKNLVIILIGIFLMGCEGEEGSLELISETQPIETVLMGDYSGSSPVFSNCLYVECFSSGNDLVFYKINTDGFNITLNVFLNSMDSSPVWSETRDNIFTDVEQIINGEIQEVSYLFGSNRDIELIIDGQDGYVVMPGNNPEMPTLLSF